MPQNRRIFFTAAVSFAAVFFAPKKMAINTLLYTAYSVSVGRRACGLWTSCDPEGLLWRISRPE